MSKWNERIVLGMVEVVIYFGHSSERVPKKLQAAIEMREYEGRGSRTCVERTHTFGHQDSGKPVQASDQE